MKIDSYKVLGVMSGTSLDGIDYCHVVFELDKAWRFKILETETRAYPGIWQRKLREAVSLPPDRLKELDREYTAFLAGQISDFLGKHHISDLDAVCSHGHTILHQPDKGITYQIGNLPVLAKNTGVKLICDFRVRDVKLGGQGAPLVPVGDKLLFPEFDACLNLGGFSNASFDIDQQRIAYDICPVNIVLNQLSGEIGLAYDHDGALAKTGRTNQDMLTELDNLEFYRSLRPKSLGLEWVRQNIDPVLISYDIPIKDKLATFVEHIARQISTQLNPLNFNRVLVTGGGALNNFLIERIGNLATAKLVIPDKQILEFKEALIFGFLGVLRMRNEVNCLKSVTGASTDHSSGEIYLP